LRRLYLTGNDSRRHKVMHNPTLDNRTRNERELGIKKYCKRHLGYYSAFLGCPLCAENKPSLCIQEAIINQVTTGE